VRTKNRATIKQAGIWKNSLILWNYLLEKVPDSIPIAYYNRVIALDEINQIDSAIKTTAGQLP